MKNTQIKQLSIYELEEIYKLTSYLNPDVSETQLKMRQEQMFEIANYVCFGFFVDTKLVGISSAWITIRLYSGKQLEIDNVIINPELQSNGYGKTFLNLLEEWAKEIDCKTVELNTYVENTRSHKFYSKHGYKHLGIHMQKTI